MNKEKQENEENQTYQIGESVRIIYHVGSKREKREEIGIYARTEPDNFVFTSLKNPGSEIFVSRNHAKIEKLTEKEKLERLEKLVAAT